MILQLLKKNVKTRSRKTSKNNRFGLHFGGPAPPEIAGPPPPSKLSWSLPRAKMSQDKPKMGLDGWPRTAQDEPRPAQDEPSQA